MVCDKIYKPFVSKGISVPFRLEYLGSDNMAKYILKRVLMALLTIFAIASLTFFLMKAIPGNPFLSEKNPPQSVIDNLNAKYGLDKPLGEQYVTYLRDVVTKLDFGPSLKQRGRQVIDIILDGMKTSARLGLIAAFSAAIAGIVLGALAALRRNTVLDKIIMVITTAFVSMPSFIMGSFLLIVFSVKLGWVPANGATAEGLILPIITLALYPMSYITRLTRSSMLDVLGQDYIRTARAKGLTEFAVVTKHALRNALIPVITVLGPTVAGLLTGSFVVEKIFAIPGIGYYFVNSVTQRDYTTIMGVTIFFAAFLMAMVLLVDIFYCLIDPRIKFDT